MKCPKCGVDLIPQTKHKVDVNFCPSCEGMWLHAQELDELENEAFSLGEHAKGTLVFSSTPTTRKCPQCEAALQRFNYRAYDLQLEFCPNQHGYWLDKDEDTHVVEAMKDDERSYGRSARRRPVGRMMQRMCTGSFLTKLKDLFR